MLITFVAIQLKPQKIAIFGPNLGKKKGKHRPRPKSKSFYFIIVTCFERVVNVFLFFVMFFLPKRGHFQRNQLCKQNKILKCGNGLCCYGVFLYASSFFRRKSTKGNNYKN